MDIKQNPALQNIWMSVLGLEFFFQHQVRSERMSTDETCKDIHYFHENWEIIRFNTCSSMMPNGSKTETGKRLTDY